MVTWPLVKYVLMAALRDRLVISLMLMIMLGACLSIFLGTSALLEDPQFTLVFAAGGLRFAGVVGLVLFTVFHIRRSFDSRDVEFLLSRPISRTSFILSHSIGFSLIALFLALCIGAMICAISPSMVGLGHGLWILSLIIEFMIVVNAALFFAMVLPSAAGGAMAVFGFYVLSRLIGQLLGITEQNIVNLVGPILNLSMKVISMVMPRLDLMAQTTWLIYPKLGGVGFGFIAAQGAVYIGLLIAAALIDLRRRQF